MRSFRRLALACVLGASFACGAAVAQPANPPADPPYTAEDAAAILDARLAALKTALKLTADQEKLWPPVEAAIRDAVKGAAARRDKREAAPPPATVLDILGHVADSEIARGEALRKFVDAAKPLVAALTPAQKNRIPAFLGVRPSETLPSSAELWIFEEEE
ncbi:Spy/CpxP family protein refolding chaperone [Xanthobacter autotrophicus DSM 431]|uniref:Spy/CpxP family protein refolding chaperone n=1 Tax=Xanthobacter nonsaccharivorans TaxID=3119912 RepID=UPI003727F1DC